MAKRLWFIWLATLASTAAAQTVTIPDAALRAAVETQLGKSTGATITQGEMATIRWLVVSGAASLNGLEHAVNLQLLQAAGGSITDLSPLSDLNSLTTLWLTGHAVANLSPLAGLTALEYLALSENSVISDLSPLSGLTALESLYLHGNSISNVAPLSGLRALNSLSLNQNSIADVGPLVANEGLGTGDSLFLHGNPLNDASLHTHIPALLSRGVSVFFDSPPPPPPPASTLSLEADATAPEGGTARLTARLTTTLNAVTTFNWRVAVDLDPATADADAEDHADASGSATIPAGETETTLTIPIADDADIEPAREWFDVVLDPPLAEADWALGRARAKVAVEEGVCDRTSAVRDALRGEADCQVPTPATLAAVEELSVSDAPTLLAGDFQGLSGLHKLSLADNGLEQLPAGLFAGLERLRTLNLSDNWLATLPPNAFADVPALQVLLLENNAFEALPAGLFSGLGNLAEASLAGNPGAPFPVAVALERTDGDPYAPPPATVAPRMASGAPFPMTAALAATPAAVANRLPGTLEILAGALSGERFRVEVPPGTGVDLQAGAPTLPTARCGTERVAMPCFRGLQAVPGETLHLFLRPPQALEPPAPAALFDDVLELSLSALVTPGDAPGPLQWHATSSDEGVATVAIRRDVLIVEPEPGAEGEATIEVMATDSTGRSVTLSFSVTVEFSLPNRPLSGWRTATLGEPEP